MAKALGEQVLKSHFSSNVLSENECREINVDSIGSNAFTYDNYAGLKKRWRGV